MRQKNSSLTRSAKTKLNILVSVMHQAVTAVIGLILPRIILQQFGSEANGLMQAISQILSYTVILEFGIGGLIKASLYKPLADNDTEAISDIFNNTKHYFGKISLIFLAFTAFLTVSTKLIVKTDFDFGYVAAMVIILAANNYFNYYFALPHRLLMQTDQKLYIIQSVQTVTNLINFAVCVGVIKLGYGIHAVKLLSMFVFLLNPLIFRWYVSKHYNISKTIFDKNRTLPRKSDGVIHHLSYFIHMNTDVVILSVFANVKAASVYTVYNAVILVMQNLLNSVSAGVAGAVGNMVAKGEKKALEASFSLYHAVNTFLTMCFSTIAMILIIPFVTIYTKNVTDVNYIQPVFAFIIIAASLMQCIRIPYNTVITAAGHYKETKVGAIGEVVINLALSLLLVKPLGLCGVAVGTLAAMTYRTCYMVWYLSKNILLRPAGKFLVSFFVNGAVGVALVAAFNKWFTVSAESFVSFFIDALVCALVVVLVFAAVNLLIWYGDKKRQ